MGFRGEPTTYCGAWEYAIRPRAAAVARGLEALRARLTSGFGTPG
jgi:hypothetical protein